MADNTKDEENLINDTDSSDELDLDNTIRPKTISEYVGPVSYTHLTLPTICSV